MNISPKNQNLKFYSHKHTVYILRGEKNSFWSRTTIWAKKPLRRTWVSWICNISTRLNLVSFAKEQQSLNKTRHTGEYNMTQQETKRNSKMSSKDIKTEKYSNYSNFCRSGFSTTVTKRSSLLSGKPPETFLLIQSGISYLNYILLKIQCYS